MSNMAIMCRCVEISLLGCVEQNVVQNVPSLTRFLPSGNRDDKNHTFCDKDGWAYGHTEEVVRILVIII